MQPLVGLIMGSKSDWPTMEHAAEMLDKLGVPYETKVVSAHRTPDLLFDYAKSCLHNLTFNTSDYARFMRVLPMRRMFQVLHKAGFMQHFSNAFSSITYSKTKLTNKQIPIEHLFSCFLF